jgi:hypothetical protein
MMDTLGWNNTEISDKDVKRLQISYYGQASIVRWLQDDNADGTGGDVTGPDIPALTRTCRQIVLTLSLEKLIYVCILVAAVISGLQSYKVDSEYEDAAWCAVVDTFILLIFGAEITVKIFAEHRKQPQHFFVDHWNTFDFVIFVGLSLTARKSPPHQKSHPSAAVPLPRGWMEKAYTDMAGRSYRGYRTVQS